MSSTVKRAVAVEVFTVAGCPNGEGALTLVEQVADEIEVVAAVRVVDVPDAEAAHRFRFLGSPTIRVAGRDVEAGTEARTDFALACRMYRTEAGLCGQPDERWVREALLHAAYDAGVDG